MHVGYNHPFLEIQQNFCFSLQYIGLELQINANSQILIKSLAAGHQVV